MGTIRKRRWAICCLGLAVATTLAPAETIFVAAGAAGASDGSSWLDAYATPDPALARAVAGDEVWIAAGIYVPSDNIEDPARSRFRIAQGVAVYGGFLGSEAAPEERPTPLAETVLSGDRNGDDLPDFVAREDNLDVVVIVQQGDANTVLDGVIVSGGEKRMGGEYGAGIRVDAGDLLVRDCIVRDNRAALPSSSYGAGIALRNGTLYLEDCLIEDNRLHGGGNVFQPSGGAGVYVRNGALFASNCHFSGNVTNSPGAAVGGGIQVNDDRDELEFSVELRDCSFVANRGPWGGGVGITHDGTARVQFLMERCQFFENSAVFGGALLADQNTNIPGPFLETARWRLVDSRFERNVATGGPAGLCLFGGDFANRSRVLHVEDCLFRDNHGSNATSQIIGGGGAGAYLRAREITVRGSRFENNILDDVGRGGFSGAGAHLLPAWKLVIEDTVFHGNAMIRNGGPNRLEGGGGGFFVQDADVDSRIDIVLRNVASTANRCASYGGGWIAAPVAGSLNSVLLENVTVAGNRVIDRISGLRIEMRADLRNSVFWGNRWGPSLSDPAGRQLGGDVANFELRDCVVENLPNNYGLIERTIDVNPRFADPLGPDLLLATGDESMALQPTSPCIDAGNNAWLAADEFDLDQDGDANEPIPFDAAGGARLVDQRLVADSGLGDAPIVDLGAYEYQHRCPGDFNNDGVVGLDDLGILLAAFGAAAGEDAFDTSLDLQPNGRIDVSDLAALLQGFGSSCN